MLSEFSWQPKAPQSSPTVPERCGRVDHDLGNHVAFAHVGRTLQQRYSEAYSTTNDLVQILDRLLHSQNQRKEVAPPG